MNPECEVATTADGGVTEAAIYFHIETRGERLRRYSNLVADNVGRLMEQGTRDDHLAACAEIADELWTMAEFIEPELPAPIITTAIASATSTALTPTKERNDG